jgi:hypothetical protein
MLAHGSWDRLSTRVPAAGRARFLQSLQTNDGDGADDAGSACRVRTVEAIIPRLDRLAVH